MSTVKIEFKSAGFQEILSSSGVRDLVSSATESKAAQVVGEGEFRHGVFLGGSAGRWIGYVAADDKKALRAESEDKVLSRLI